MTLVPYLVGASKGDSNPELLECLEAVSDEVFEQLEPHVLLHLEAQQELAPAPGAGPPAGWRAAAAGRDNAKHQICELGAIYEFAGSGVSCRGGSAALRQRSSRAATVLQF